MNLAYHVPVPDARRRRAQARTTGGGARRRGRGPRRRETEAAPRGRPRPHAAHFHLRPSFSGPHPDANAASFSTWQRFYVAQTHEGVHGPAYENSRAAPVRPGTDGIFTHGEALVLSSARSRRRLQNSSSRGPRGVVGAGPPLLPRDGPRPEAMATGARPCARPGWRGVAPQQPHGGPAGARPGISASLSRCNPLS